MNSYNIAMVFTPCIIKPKTYKDTDLMKTLQLIYLLQAMIDETEYFFSDSKYMEKKKCITSDSLKKYESNFQKDEKIENEIKEKKEEEQEKEKTNINESNIVQIFNYGENEKINETEENIIKMVRLYLI